MMGFTDAYVLAGGAVPEQGIWLPATNRPDEVRWAFMKWAHKNFDQREMPAAEGLLQVIKSEFPCQ